MGRVVLGLACMVAVVATAGCKGTYDCEEACDLMRECGLAVGASRETCAVRCIENESDKEDAIDSCGDCLDTDDCSPNCRDECVCALSLDTAEYSGVACGP